MSQMQKTICESVSLKGKGLHTGYEVNITFHPAPENHGYKFQRTDLEGNPFISLSSFYAHTTSLLLICLHQF